MLCLASGEMQAGAPALDAGHEGLGAAVRLHEGQHGRLAGFGFDGGDPRSYARHVNAAGRSRIGAQRRGSLAWVAP